MIKKLKRRGKTSKQVGERNNNKKLSEQDVHEIQKLLNLGLSNKNISKKI